MPRLLVALGLFLLASPALAQPCRDARVRIQPDCRFTPMQSSAAVAYLASAGATAALVGGGYLLYAYGPGDPTRSSFTSEEVGLAVIALGAMLGPSAGNLTLGAGDAVAQGMKPKLIGGAIGSGIGLVGLSIGVGCFLASGSLDGGSGGCDGAGRTGITLMIVGLGVTAAGLAVGTVIDLVTIPSSARRLRAEQNAEHPAVTVALGPGGVALRVAL